MNGDEEHGSSARCDLCGQKERRLFRIASTAVTCAFCIRRTGDLLLRGKPAVVRSLWGDLDLLKLRGDLAPGRMPVDEQTRVWLDGKGKEPFTRSDAHAMRPEFFAATGGFYGALGSRSEELGAAARALVEGSLGDAMAQYRDAALAIVFRELDSPQIARLVRAINSTNALRRRRQSAGRPRKR